MHKWLGFTFFPRNEGRIVRIEEMKLMFAMIKKRKISPVKLMVHYWLLLHILQGPITITSWVTRLATNLNLLGNITFIIAPWRSLDFYFFCQADLLKRKNNKIYMIYKGYVNEYELPNRSLGLYVVENFVLILQRPETGVGRCPSAGVTGNTTPRYRGEDDTPLGLAHIHYQGFDQAGPSGARHQ